MQEIMKFYISTRAQNLIIAPVLIEMSYWIYIKHRPSRRAKFDFISRSVENDRLAVAEDVAYLD